MQIVTSRMQMEIEQERGGVSVFRKLLEELRYGS